MRHNRDVIGRRECRDFEEFRESTEPHDVGLDDIDVAALHELAESEARVLVLTGSELDGWVGALEERLAVEVVGAEALLPPVDVEALLLGALDELDGVGDVERHVAVDAEGEVRAHGFALFAEVFDILEETFNALVGPVGEGYLRADKAGLFSRAGLRAGAVEVEPGTGGTADEFVDGLIADLADKVPEGEVDDGNDGDGKAFAAVEHGASIHLLEELIDVAGI
jgi:hypothetical protein